MQFQVKRVAAGCGVALGAVVVGGVVAATVQLVRQARELKDGPRTAAEMCRFVGCQLMCVALVAGMLVRDRIKEWL